MTFGPPIEYLAEALRKALKRCRRCDERECDECAKARAMLENMNY